MGQRGARARRRRLQRTRAGLPAGVVVSSAPAPVYQPAPVYAAPAPVYVAPAYTYPYAYPYAYPPVGISLNLGYSRGWGGHYHGYRGWGGYHGWHR